jgi:hypothetical protein
MNVLVFLSLYRSMYEMDRSMNIFLKHYSLQRVAQLLSADTKLLCQWYELFAEQSMATTCDVDDEQELLADSTVLQIYEDLCVYFTKVYHNDFLSQKKSTLTSKKQSLRSSLPCSVKRKVSGDDNEGIQGGGSTKK